MQMRAKRGQRWPWKTRLHDVVNSEVGVKQPQQDTGSINWWDWPGQSPCGSSFLFLCIRLGAKELHYSLLPPPSLGPVLLPSPPRSQGRESLCTPTERCE